ncbi:hypothetical protein ACSAZL_08855 [Methanosarcina sp. T3]|uniref:hypothetical protein n=1 Tax=Methanosarcina sp. T3 TaxID=3439062 RepID=UPI003F834AD1
MPLPMPKPRTSSPCPSAIKKALSISAAPKNGRKIEILKKNPMVCFEAAIETELITADDPCNYNVRYRSVIGYGKAKFL